jgi:exopolysaccharide biosynthesis protein
MKKLLIILSTFIVLFISVPNESHTVQNKFSVKQLNFDNLGIDGKINVIEIFKDAISYEVTNKNHREYDFYVNANYFTIENIPVGEVVIDGKVVRRNNKNGGYFTTDGKSPKFYYNRRPSGVMFSSQTHTPIIMDGNPNTRIFNKSWARIKLPRLVIGKKSNGNIVVIHTIGKTRCSVSDFYNISKSLQLKDALMLDGGASIEVGLTYKNFNYKYQIVSDIERKIGKVPTPSVFIVGNFN